MNKIMIDDKEYELEFIKDERRPWYELHGGEIITRYYKCPICGEGLYVHVDEDTPGDRDHYSYIKCENCDPDQLIYTNSYNMNSWDLRTTTLEERKKTLEFRKRWE